ncbi:GNAT family N-acetyltransferase, partial [Aeromonas veronii]
KGIGQLSGITMPSNRGMVTLARKVGFKVEVSMEDNLVSMVLPLVVNTP